MDDLAHFFSEHGPLAAATAGFRVRPQQVALAQTIEAALREGAVLLAEAGTGTGKTYAYLVPALLSGGRVLISTGTRTLQDQLFNRDLPAVREALGVPAVLAVLKGRANYVCHLHLERARAHGRFHSREEATHLEAIVRFAQRSHSGDRSELPDVPEDAAVWPQVTSTRDNCLGAECPHVRDCFVMAARRRAQRADIVVINHHLFFADAALREEGVAELLPDSQAVIFDEAHLLPEVASLFYGESLSTGQLADLAGAVQQATAAAAPEAVGLPQAAARVVQAARDLRMALGLANGRLLPGEMAAGEGGATLTALADALAGLVAQLAVHAERSEELSGCLSVAGNALDALQRWCGDEPTDSVRWAELFNHTVRLHATPLSVAPLFEKQLAAGPRAWIFTSATLAVRGSFAHYQESMGLADARTAIFDSPFDYARQALLYLPEGMPDPNTSGYTQAVIDAALPLIRAAGGRAFLLFTSLRAMREGHALLQAALAREALDFPVLLQGEGARSQLLDRFRNHGNAVLVASHSFWEGVDVRGEALSLVVIDRLPFAPPDDPVLAARMERMARDGRNAFMSLQLPQAVITLKQGAGRLIRDEGDRGVLMICDPRLTGKSYGRRMCDSLPPMRRTRALAEAQAFLGADAPAVGENE